MADFAPDGSSDATSLQRELDQLRSQLKSKDSEIESLKRGNSSKDGTSGVQPDKKSVNPLLKKKLSEATTKTRPDSSVEDDDDEEYSDQEGSDRASDHTGSPPAKKPKRTSSHFQSQVRKDPEVSSSDEDNPAVNTLVQLVDSLKKRKGKKKKSLKLPRYAHAGPQRNEDKLCGELQEGAPELLETLFRSVYSRKEIKETLENIERPSNCEALRPVMINKEIYSHMSEKERKKDEPLKFIANAVAKASQPLANVWNQLLQLETDLRESKGIPPDAEMPVSLDIDEDTGTVLHVTHLVELLDQSLKVLGMATAQIAQKRRLDLKYKLAPDCKDLAKRSQPFTSCIFGDNMKASALENRKERSISYSITHGKSGVMKDLKSFLDQHKSSHRGQSYGSQRGFRGGSSPFKHRGRNQSSGFSQSNQSPQNSQNRPQGSQQFQRGQSANRGRGGRGRGGRR